VSAIGRLRDRGNTVIAVDHEPDLIRSADRVVEFGPRAGHDGGRIVFQGSPRQLLRDRNSLTGNYLAGRSGVAVPDSRRPPRHGVIQLVGARGNNLRSITVEFPLGVLCVVAGVSGAGKSTLVRRTLYPAIAQRKGAGTPPPLPLDNVLGIGQIDEVVLVERKMIGRSSRSNPVTYVKAFDEIRALFAATTDAKARGIKPADFSFNIAGGRCEKCKGEGLLTIDLQFMEDLLIQCDLCGGRRYRRDILEIRYRDKSIFDVLEMTVRQSFSFFRGQRKLQAKLKLLFDVGLDYLRLGQPISTLSTGEAQRLKLASYLGRGRRGRCLFLLEEPTTGLHMDDVVKLIDCLDSLLAVGHSIVAVEHSLQFMQYADWIVELGPGAADAGGQLIAQGTPESLADNPDSITGPFLKHLLDGNGKLRRGRDERA
jgi:excinuclease ABC subunit A